MKRLLATLLTLTSINCFLFAQNPVNDFRGFAWGSPFTQVQKNEKSKFVSNDKDDILLFQDVLAGADCDVIYQFNDNNKLVSGTYIFTKKYSNPQLYLKDYSNFKQLLTQKYGKPKSENEEWSSNTTPADKENYGQAITDGNLSLNSVWMNDRTIIKITLVTFNQHPSLQIHYTAKSLDELENKEELKSALPKL